MAQNKPMTIAGWVLTGLIAASLTMGGVMKLLQVTDLKQDFTGKFGYPESALVAIGLAELTSMLLFVMPRTAVLGAVLLTGYLGGAVATHVRISESFAAPAIMGVLVWVALYLRDGRIRALLPLRQPAPPGGPG